MTSTLFSPYTFIKSGKTAPNRIVLAPMTNMQSHADGTLSEDEYTWLMRRAKEGFGIIITCAAHVSLDGQGWKGELGIFDDKHIPGLQRLTNDIKACGSLSVMQIFHGGARSPEDVTEHQPWSASAHTMQISKTPVEVREGSVAEIESTISTFVAAAHRAFKAGFDGVELHGAHGYLLHQFISTFTNQRSDEWGGSFENRTRLVRTILQRIKAELPKEFMVGVRLSPEDKLTFKGIDFDESLELASLLAIDGADFIHLSPWDAFKRPDKYPDLDQPIVTYFRNQLPNDVAVMVAGNIWSQADAVNVLHHGADFLALGKVAIAIPEWPTEVKQLNYNPPRPPYTVERLKAANLSDKFVGYMKRWAGFVVPD